MLCLTLTLAQNLSSIDAEHTVSQLLDSLRTHPDAAGGEVGSFRAIGQHQVQGCLATAQEAVGFILSAARSDIWGVHLTIISDDPDLLELETDSQVDHIMEVAAETAAQALRAVGSVRVVAARAGELRDAQDLPEVGAIESTLQLLASIERRRSEEGQEAGLMVNAGYSQTAAASELGVTQQAISSRLQAGYWYESRSVAYWLARQINALTTESSALLRE